jgi:hypothetical protein
MRATRRSISIAPRSMLQTGTSRYGDDLHPLRCLLLDLLTAGPPAAEEAALLAAFALRFRRRGVGPGPRPGGAERPYVSTAAIRFSLKCFRFDQLFNVSSQKQYFSDPFFQL